MHITPNRSDAFNICGKIAAMSTLASRTKTATRVATYYWNKPSRWQEIPTWVRGRRAGLLDVREPWWNRRAIDAVASALPDGARVFEFGGGGSTPWFGDRVAEVVTVEHDEEWFDVLKASAPTNAKVELRRPSPQGTMASESAPGAFFDDYVHAILEQPDESFDLVVVDGRARVDCGRAAISKIAPGGMLFMDDSDRPRYNPLVRELESWNRTDYRGLKRAGDIAQSTIWTRP